MRREPRITRPGGTVTTLIVAVLAIAAGVGVGYYLAGRFPNLTGPVQPQATKTETAAKERITALGRIQPAAGVVPVYGPPGDRIAKLYPLAPGTQLTAGQPVAELASRKDRLQEVQVAQTQLNEAKSARDAAAIAGTQKILAAKAERDKVKANKESDLAALKAKNKFLKLQAESAAKQVKRLETLRAKDVTVADEDIEKARLLQAQAEAELAAGEALYDKTKTTYEQTEKAAQAQIDAAEAELNEALARAPIKSSEEKLELAKQLAELTIIKAPISGVVLKVTGREGQPTGIEPILHMADLGKMTVVAEVYESDVAQLSTWVKAGPVPAEVTNTALPQPLKGTVRSEADITRMIARNQVFAMGPREDTDRRVVEVVVHLDDASSAIAARFVGLQVTVTFTPK